MNLLCRRVKVNCPGCGKLVQRPTNVSYSICRCGHNITDVPVGSVVLKANATPESSTLPASDDTTCSQ